MERERDKNIFVGLDIGSISAKAVVITPDSIDYFATERTRGRPIEIAEKIVDDINRSYGENNIKTVVVTGAAGKAFANCANVSFVNEFQAASTAIRFIHPEARTILEIGGQTSKYILLDDTGIVDYGVNGDCAAGTGSFIDQQASRLHYKVEDIGELVAQAKKTARIAGRCSVFAKSDMIHAQQMGYLPDEVLRGLCKAVVRNFKAAIVKGRKIARPVVFIGGVALNRGMIPELKEAFGVDDRSLIVPKNPDYISALGCALEAKISDRPVTRHNTVKTAPIDRTSTPEPLSTADVVFLRDKIGHIALPEDKKTDVFLGIDVGSVSTNVVITDGVGNLIHDIYTMTRARPIEVVGECLKEVKTLFGAKINVLGVGTTGSGRELIGELVGADTIRDEITAHKTGAVHISATMTDSLVDTIFEIGGQDSKFIRIENGVVVDFTMNEACAAGTGSFLEEQAEKLGIKIKGEFAELALSSKTPLKLGERCTVFMERDVDAYQTRGASVKDIVAGLSYSVVLNYLNRVVRGRQIGNTIFFQGGTAYNDAVAAAFAIVLKKKIIVPPHNGVIGAVGAALLARDKILESQGTTSFKGFDIGKIDYKIREFTCKACTNECDVQEFTVDGSKTYWGDKCSSRYRKKTKVSGKTVLADLFEERNGLLLDGYEAQKKDSRLTIGIPRAMYFYDRFPFWHTYLNGIGFRVVVSEETNKKIIEAGITSRVSEPCHPIGVAHGHVKNLLDRGADYIWLPNILTAEHNGQDHVRPYLCPWGMTLPFMVSSSPTFEGEKEKFIAPTLHHLHGEDFLSNQLWSQVAKKFGVNKSTHRSAFQNAAAAQQKFRNNLAVLGEMALHKLAETEREAVVLIGRPYNLFDRSVNLNIPAKLKTSYGVDAIPFDLLPTADIEITDIAEYMFWNYGKKILSTARFIANRPDLHIIYITNFKCGPDSFVKHFAKDAVKKPFLVLQFDEHSNDAGMMTRVEAYLDSKELLGKKRSSAPFRPNNREIIYGQRVSK